MVSCISANASGLFFVWSFLAKINFSGLLSLQHINIFYNCAARNCFIALQSYAQMKPQRFNWYNAYLNPQIPFRTESYIKWLYEHIAYWYSMNFSAANMLELRSSFRQALHRHCKLNIYKKKVRTLFKPLECG